MRKWMPMVLCALLLLPLNVRAEGETAGPETTESPAPSATADASITAGGPDIAAETAVLIDARSGSVLYQKYAQQKMNPASLVKILSVYLACENLPADSELTASADALSGYDRSASSIWLSEGETAKAVDLEYAAIMASANDANSVLAEAVSQSLDAFTAKMNETVNGWGLSGTQLDNPNGFTSDSEYSPPTTWP
jgi:D-alanyl-D-alanine carboxypeptidase (penicillin-binding protein 5/6)